MRAGELCLSEWSVHPQAVALRWRARLWRWFWWEHRSVPWVVLPLPFCVFVFVCGLVCTKWALLLLACPREFQGITVLIMYHFIPAVSYSACVTFRGGPVLLAWGVFFKIHLGLLTIHPSWSCLEEATASLDSLTADYWFYLNWPKGMLSASILPVCCANCLG